MADDTCKWVNSRRTKEYRQKFTLVISAMPKLLKDLSMTQTCISRSEACSILEDAKERTKEWEVEKQMSIEKLKKEILDEALAMPWKPKVFLDNFLKGIKNLR